MAKSYVLEDIVDLNTGRIDPTKLAKMTSKDSALTGAFKEIGQIVGTFPETIGKGAKGGDTMGYNTRRLSRTTIPGIAGEVIAIAGNLPRSMAARRVASPKYQAKTTPTDYRPTRERMGYGELTPEPAPLSLAPEGEALPTTRQSIEPSVRPTLELMPKDAEIAALRNKGARTPLGPEPVEFTPGGGQDFMLRQEGLTQPAMAEAIDGFRAKAADLENKVANSQGFWKQRYQAELDALKQEFGAGMEMFGVQDAQGATGLRRKLYESGGETSLPIVKTLRRQ
jgi:hypothetical protein